MADMLTEGIVKQFPNMFSGCKETNSHEVMTSKSNIILRQNSPNPFSDRTVISYFIPENVREVQVVIFDAMGVMIKKFDIHTKGQGSITFYPPSLSKGVFTYSIIADGRLVTTKKMIR